MMRKINESGRTMLEMMGVLAIMGIIMYGAIVGIGFGVDLYKVTATHSDLEEISQTVMDLYSWSDGFPDDVDIGAVLCNKELAPMPCGDALASRWTEGHIDIEGSSDHSYFIVHVTDIPEMACKRLEKMDYQNLCFPQIGDKQTNCDNRSLYLVSNGASNGASHLCDDSAP